MTETLYTKLVQLSVYVLNKIQ